MGSRSKAKLRIDPSTRSKLGDTRDRERRRQTRISILSKLRLDVRCLSWDRMGDAARVYGRSEYRVCLWLMEYQVLDCGRARSNLYTYIIRILYTDIMHSYTLYVILYAYSIHSYRIYARLYTHIYSICCIIHGLYILHGVLYVCMPSFRPLV